jgi:hypothetical protein
LLRPAAPLLLHGAKFANLLIHAHQVFAELLETAKLGDFLSRLEEGSRVGERLCHRLARGSAGQPKLGIVAGIVRLGAMTGWLSAAANHGVNRARAQITQAQELFRKFGALGFQSSKIAGIGLPSECTL